jgi:hypothetical protein
MIHETLKSGGSITHAKGNDRELIVTLMISKGSLGNVFFLHTYLVVARTKIKFGNVLKVLLMKVDMIKVLLMKT